MEERLTFGDTLLGVLLLMHTRATLAAAGFTTRLETTVFHGFTLHTCVATPETRLSRKERGL